MDLTRTDAQRLLTSVAREFLDKHCSLAVAQALASDSRRSRMDLWRRVSELGWPGLLVPADFGGGGAALLDVVLLVEEMGRAALPGPFVPSAVVATSLLASAGTRAQQSRLLPDLATGDRRCTVAVAETSDAVHADRLAVTVDRDAPLSGAKRFVPDADLAQHLVVVGRGRGRISAALVETSRAGIRLEARETMAGDRVFDVTFDGVRIGHDDLLELDGWAPVADALARGAVARAAEMVGAAQRILELVVDHAKVRVQSGRAIGSFQAIQHACADLLRDVEVTRGVVHHAAWQIDGGADAVTAAAMPKAYAGRTALAVARRAHQIFGAIGYSREHPLHLLHKRIHAAAMDCGDRAAHLAAIADTIGLA